jgi:hypothetical protein
MEGDANGSGPSRWSEELWEAFDARSRGYPHAGTSRCADQSVSPPRWPVRPPVTGTSSGLGLAARPNRATTDLVTVEPSHPAVMVLRSAGWRALSLSRLRRCSARGRRPVKGAASAAAEGGAEGPTLTARRHARQSRRLRDRAPTGDRCAGRAEGQVRRPGQRRGGSGRGPVGGAADCGRRRSGSTSGSSGRSSSTSVR